MSSWIERAKSTLTQIVTNVVNSCDGLKVRVCFVGYRDYGNSERFSIHGFTEDIEEIKKYINGVKAMSNGPLDIAEDVVGGLRNCLDQSWSANSSK
jgi:hypothetical protein